MAGKALKLPEYFTSNDLKKLSAEKVFEKENYQKNVTSVDNDEIKKLLLHSWITSKGYEHIPYEGTNETESSIKGKKFRIPLP